MENNFLIIGSGAREHAIAKCFNKSQREKKLFCVGTNMNPGIAEVCKDFVLGNINDPDFIVKYAKSSKINIAIIGPENPLKNGISDALWKANIKVVGPKKKLAQIETSKSFARDLLKEYNIKANPFYKKFSSMNGVENTLDFLGENHVIKYDGLAGGKGVKVFGEHLFSKKDSMNYCFELVDKKRRFIIEQKLNGEEFSLMSFCDGKTIIHMPVVQDHKRAYEGDTGPNTGGMGTYTNYDHSLPFLTQDNIEKAQHINKAVSEALKDKLGESYKGILYGGFIATSEGVKLVEYNARFGDPEAMNILSILENDFITICHAIVDEKLDSINLSFKNKATVCKYAVPDGYPDNPIKGETVDISGVANINGLFYGSVALENNQLLELGSRTMAVVGVAKTIEEAEIKAEQEIVSIKGPLFHRSDIGKTELIQKKINRMNLIR